jgi:hypothetical protein
VPTQPTLGEEFATPVYDARQSAEIL